MSDFLSSKAPAWTRRNKGRRRSPCYHEAGHLVSRWYFGGRLTKGFVLSGAQVIAGDWGRDADGVLVPDAEGQACGQMYGPDPFLGPAGIGAAEHGLRRAYQAAAEADMVIAGAGPWATARYNKQSIVVAFLSGGMVDHKKIGHLAQLWFETKAEQVAMHNLTDRRCQALVRSVPGWQAITQIAEVMYAAGEIDGAQAEDICLDAYGHAAPGWYEWYTNWPPSLGMIARGAGVAGHEAT